MSRFMFITPTELAATLERHGLRVGPLAGLGPRAKLPTLVPSLVSAKRGRITYGEFSRRLNFGRVQRTSISYMGFAIKEDAA